MLILPREPLSHIGEYRHPLLPRLYLSGLFTIDDVQPHEALRGSARLLCTSCSRPQEAVRRL